MTWGQTYLTAMMPARKAAGARLTVGNITIPSDTVAVVPLSGLVGRRMLGASEKSTCKVGKTQGGESERQRSQPALTDPSMKRPPTCPNEVEPSTYTELEIVPPGEILIGVDDRQIHGPGRHILHTCIHELSMVVKPALQQSST